MRRKDRQISNNNVIDEIIKKADVCRIALYDGDYPYIVIMNFGYHKGNPSSLYFHCAQKGKKIDIIKKNNKVCFELDIEKKLITSEKACDFGMIYKSVIGYGKISIIKEIDEKLSGLNIIMRHYSEKEVFNYDKKILKNTMILRLDIERITGKQKIPNQ